MTGTGAWVFVRVSGEQRGTVRLRFLRMVPCAALLLGAVPSERILKRNFDLQGHRITKDN